MSGSSVEVSSQGSAAAASSDDEGDGADAMSGFGSGDEADDGGVVSDGEDEAGEVYFTRRSIVPRGADERHWTKPPPPCPQRPADCARFSAAPWHPEAQEYAAAGGAHADGTSPTSYTVFQ